MKDTIKYTMPLLTEKQRKELMEELEEVIKAETHSVYGITARIALAVLTAEPDVYVSQKTYSGPHLETRVYRVEAKKDLTLGYSLYTLPPVAMIKTIELPPASNPELSQGGWPWMVPTESGKWINKEQVIEAIHSVGLEVK